MRTREALSSATTRQYGLVTAAQAGQLGITAEDLAQAVREGVLWQPGWAVYQLTDAELAPRYAYPYAAWLALAPDVFAWERTAVLEEDAVVSHESACQLWGLASFPATQLLFTATTARTDLPGIEVRAGQPPLTSAEVTRVHGVPLTTAHRTVLDLVRSWTEQKDIRRALTDSVRLDLVDLALIYQDLMQLGDVYDLPTDPAEFAGRLLGDLDPGRLSARNRVAYDNLVNR